MKRRLATFFVLFILAGLAGHTYSKPYYFYAVLNKDGRSSDIYIRDLNNNNERLFLTYPREVYDLRADDNQEWLFFLCRRHLFAYKISDINKNYELIDACEELGGIVYLDKIGLIYVSWTDPVEVSQAIEKDECEPVHTAIFDVKTMKPVKTLSEEIIIHENAFASEDQSKIYTIGYETEGDLKYIQTISTKTNSIVAKTNINAIEPETNIKLIEEGEKGEVLISYEYPVPEFSDNNFMVYDLERNLSKPSMHFPYRSKGYIVKSKQAVIAEEVVLGGKISAGEYTTGNISVFNYNTGKLIKNYSLPPSGELLVFKNYPDHFYYLTQDKQLLKMPLP